jgi:hypothetical protein
MHLIENGGRAPQTLENPAALGYIEKLFNKTGVRP